MMNKLLFAFCITALFACTKKEEKKCIGLIMHQVKVVDNNEKPVVFDKYFTAAVLTTDTLKISKYRPDSTHYYPLIDDHYIKLLPTNVSTAFTFVAIKGTDTLKSGYTFISDGCHISLEKGEAKIVFK